MTNIIYQVLIAIVCKYNNFGIYIQFNLHTHIYAIIIQHVNSRTRACIFREYT